MNESGYELRPPYCGGAPGSFGSLEVVLDSGQKVPPLLARVRPHVVTDCADLDLGKQGH